MSGEEEERLLPRREVRIRVVRGGNTSTLSGLLKRSTRQLGRGRGVRFHLMEGGKNLVAFSSGLLLASLYGFMAVLLQKQSLWFCVYTTVTLAGLAAFSMGLSAGARANIMVMLPSMCSARGRSFILLLFMSLLLSGPLDNTLENTERAASSLLCGAEVAANQTKELMQRAATPLFSVLDDIREISRNARAVAGRVQNFINALTDSVRHVARTLRNVLHFLVDIGDICNDKLGVPYRKCQELFAGARSDCTDLLGEFNFLCDIVDTFLPLCNIARAGEFFCIIPSYVATHLKQRLADLAAFRKMMREFDFNISASVKLDLDVNSSRSVQQVSQDILNEISSDLRVLEKLREPLVYCSLVLLGWSFLRAVRYKRRYLRELDFDNVYITAQFRQLDERLRLGGGASVLPLTRREANTYISPRQCTRVCMCVYLCMFISPVLPSVSLQLSFRERRAVLVGVVSVLRHMLMGGLLVVLDFLVFWILDQVHLQVKGDMIARAPVRVAVQVNGSGYASDIFRDLVASFDILQGGNVTVISRKCLLEPLQPDATTCSILVCVSQKVPLTPVGSWSFEELTVGSKDDWNCGGKLCEALIETSRKWFLLALALCASLTGGLVQRCRRLVCASYHPEREQERILFLHQKILDQRRVSGTALRRAAVRTRAQQERGGGGGGGGRGGLRALLMRLPGGAYLVQVLGLSSSVTCLSCGETVTAREPDTVTCSTPQCSGVLCRPCFHSLGSVCFVCQRPPTFQEDEEEEELDSSDEERLSLNSAISTEMRRRGRRVSMATHGPQPGGGEEDESEHRDSSVYVLVGSELSSSEADMDYQDFSGSDDSDSDDSFYLALSPEAFFLQNRSPAPHQDHEGSEAPSPLK
ncbi:DC-STAMP domain-containing protein 2 isoform X4 [Oryzias melastigma]|uniref:DC-STAMP domain-containing protein 2 isoform X4 n=1 Tax=Oryzias melastigma TaxID=30732 RepID=UPI00168CF9FC|nr:DC-STAMP domain-containing protein 2 isoform X4 [Oryzias melastigma]